jgi:hypothetical protein
MRKNIVVLFGNLFFLLFQSCSSVQTVYLKPSPKTIVLNEKEFSVDSLVGYNSWFCHDFVKGGPVEVEVGFFGSKDLLLGFILYDGGIKGEVINYERAGLEHHWDWGPNKNDYSFVLKTDGTGLYYDFTNVEKGKSIKPKTLYKCGKR